MALCHIRAVAAVCTSARLRLTQAQPTRRPSATTGAATSSDCGVVASTR